MPIPGINSPSLQGFRGAVRTASTPAPRGITFWNWHYAGW